MNFARRIIIFTPYVSGSSQARSWTFAIGFTLSIGGLTAKLWMAYSVLKERFVRSRVRCHLFCSQRAWHESIEFKILMLLFMFCFVEGDVVLDVWCAGFSFDH